MKRQYIPANLILILSLIFSGMAGTVFAQAPNQTTCGNSTTFTLWAGQSIYAGIVTVSNTDNQLILDINLVDGWVLQESQVQVGASLSDIPTNNSGVPVPGQFDKSTRHFGASHFTYAFPFNANPGDTLVIALHTTVALLDSSGNAVQQETAWAGSNSGSGERWWYYMTYTVQECTQTAVTSDKGKGKGKDKGKGNSDSNGKGKGKGKDKGNSGDKGKGKNKGNNSGSGGSSDSGSSSSSSGSTSSSSDGEGCTPGYWKNHQSAWTATNYSPEQSVGSVFGAAPGSLSGSNLLGALSFQGGSDYEGAAEILLRASVASVLNATHPEIAYPRSAGSIISDVNAALASGDRSVMLTLAGGIDNDNNLGCDLGGDNSNAQDKKSSGGQKGQGNGQGKGKGKGKDKDGSSSD